MVGELENFDQNKTARFPDAPDEVGPGTEFMFIQGMTVVGTVNADCAVCAWREGHEKWPHALLAVWCGQMEPGRNASFWSGTRSIHNTRRRGPC